MRKCSSTKFFSFGFRLLLQKIILRFFYQFELWCSSFVWKIFFTILFIGVIESTKRSALGHGLCSFGAIFTLKDAKSGKSWSFYNLLLLMQHNVSSSLSRWTSTLEEGVNVCCHHWLAHVFKLWITYFIIALIKSSIVTLIFILRFIMSSIIALF